MTPSPCDLMRQAAEALVEVIGWVPGRKVWHTDAPAQAVERARAVLAALRSRLEQAACEGWPCEIITADFEANTVTLQMHCQDYRAGAGKHVLMPLPSRRTD